jgi:hypothetical protein
MSVNLCLLIIFNKSDKKFVLFSFYVPIIQHILLIFKRLLLFKGPIKCAHLQNKEVLITERLISRKILSGGPQSVQYKELLVIGRCSYIEVLLYYFCLFSTLYSFFVRRFSLFYFPFSAFLYVGFSFPMYILSHSIFCSHIWYC